jgi:hypothetical protein
LLRATPGNFPAFGSALLSPPRSVVHALLALLGMPQAACRKTTAIVPELLRVAPVLRRFATETLRERFS